MTWSNIFRNCCLLFTKAISDEPGIANKSLKEQFNKLVFKPLSKVHPTWSASSIILVIDALDECEREGDVRTILSLLASTRQLGSVRMRVFLTSRPELPTRLGFAKMGAEVHRDVALHEVLPSTISPDIIMYLEDEFARIRDEHNCLWPADQSLAPDWPGRAALQTLAQLAVPLFIVAATICRFVSDPRGDPSERLATVLHHQTTGQMSQLERTYLPVLSQLTVGVEEAEEKDKLWQDFREIVGSIVLLANPLSSVSLSKLLNTTKRKVDHQLRLLHSVLCVPSDPDASVQLLHHSFREFLVQNQHGRQEPVAINKATVHRYLAERCRALLQGPGGVSKDMCLLGHPGVQQQDIDPTIVNLSIPQHLRYACLYWVHHIQHSGRRISDDDNVDGFLRQHFLHWLESLSLIGKITESVNFVNTLKSLVAEKNSQVFLFLHDAWRFVLTFNPILAQAPLQVYSSAWHFSPLRSIVRSTFQDQELQAVRVTSGIPEQWNACLLTYEGHSGPVSSVVFSPDGSRVASGSRDNTVRVLDVQTGQCQHTLESHSNSVNIVVFSPDGSGIVSGSDDNTVCVWNVSTGQCQHTLKGHSSTVRSVNFSPDGSRIASGSDDNTVRIWDVQTGQCQHTFKGHSGTVRSVIFSPDGLRVASGSYDNTVRVWNVQTSQCQHTLKGHSGRVRSVMFSPDGLRIASGSHSNTVRVWNVQTGQCQHTLKGHLSRVRSVVFSPDGSRVASGSWDQTVRIWDVQTGQCEHILKGHSDRVRSVVFSPDGSRVASGSWDQMVRVWDVQTGQLRHIFEGHSAEVNSVMFSPDGSRVVSGASDQTVRVWDVQTDQFQHTFKSHLTWVSSLVFSPDGLRVVSGSYDKTIYVWDVQTGQCQHTLKDHSGSVSSVMFSPDGSRIASGSYDNTVRVWDVQTGQCQHVLEGHSNSVNSLAFSPGGSRVVSGSGDNTVRIWDVQTGQCQYTLESHSKLVNIVIFSPDGSRVVSGSDDNTVCVWDVQTGQFQYTFKGHAGTVNSVVFSPDGSRVASGSRDNTVRVWDVQTGQCQHTLKGHSDLVISVVFSPDGSRVASDSYDKTMRVWDVVSSTELMCYDTQAYWHEIEFSDDSMKITVDGDLLSIPSQTQKASTVAGAPEPSPKLPVSKLGIKGDWVTLSSDKILWLPPEYRPRRWASNSDTIVIGSPTGRVTFVRCAATRSLPSQRPLFASNVIGNNSSRRNL